MPNRAVNKQVSDAIEIACSIIDALELWIDKRYAGFLRDPQPASITKEWFEWFQGEWRVARTIKGDSKEAVRKYLDANFRQSLTNSDSGEVVDEAAIFIQRQRWSSAQRKDGAASVPRSLVSKVGFILSPLKIVPYDSFARGGLNVLRGTKKNRGKGHLKGTSYAEYLKAFDVEFQDLQPVIRSELEKPWSTELFQRLRCPASVAKSEKFHRKVFDNYLMRIGGRAKPT